MQDDARCHYKDKRDVISNPPNRTGLDFKSSHFDPVLGFALDLIKFTQIART
jgi:hypothetical protein